VAVSTTPEAPAVKGPARDTTSDAAGLGVRGALAFVAPGLVLVAAFLVFPALWTLYLGLTDYRLTGLAAADPQFVGLENYRDALADDDFRNSLVKTLAFVAGSALIGQMILGFTLAWLLRDARRVVRRTLETVVLLAWILPSSIVAFLWIAYLNDDRGTLNSLLGLQGTAWLIEHPMLSIIIFNTWRGTAFSMLLFTAALAAVPPSQLETARLAGAGTWGQLRDVVLPNIRGHVLTNALLISLWTFNDFTPYLITAGGPNHATEILPVYIYNTALYGGELGVGAAISLIMLVANLMIAMLYVGVLRKRSP